MSDLERRLRFALAPVEPPLALTDRFERTLTELTDAAAEELADWELRAMRDPRNWVRPAAALLVGGVAGGTLIVVQARQRQRRRRPRGLRGLERRVRDTAGSAMKAVRR
ncbi:MAG: hypothetical protein H0V55_09390 [Thermoleophilaceae bacterium]|jgi:hypothetical protein|nr:hypothetical protein [Thermoleophilaceae bacterium]